MRPEDDSVLPVVRAAELDEPEPERRWLIEQLWARAGVGIIGGAPKLGKSWLGLDLAVSIASGTPCLDTFRVAEPGGALIYMAEDAAPIVKQRLEGPLPSPRPGPRRPADRGHYRAQHPARPAA